MHIKAEKIVDGAFIIALISGMLYMLGEARRLAWAGLLNVPREIYREDIPRTVGVGAESIVEMVVSYRRFFSEDFEWAFFLFALAPVASILVGVALFLRAGYRIYPIGLLVVVLLWCLVFFHSRVVYGDILEEIEVCESSQLCKRAKHVKLTFEQPGGEASNRAGYLLSVNAHYWAIKSKLGLVVVPSKRVIAVEEVPKL